MRVATSVEKTTQYDTLYCNGNSIQFENVAQYFLADTVFIVLRVGTWFKLRINISQAQQIYLNLPAQSGISPLNFPDNKCFPIFESESADDNTAYTSASSRVFLVVCLHSEGHR